MNNNYSWDDLPSDARKVFGTIVKINNLDDNEALNLERLFFDRIADCPSNNLTFCCGLSLGVLLAIYLPAQKGIH